MENMECSKIYASVKILDSHICGRTTVRTGMCHGDSGNFLVKFRENVKHFTVTEWYMA